MLLAHVILIFWLSLVRASISNICNLIVWDEYNVVRFVPSLWIMCFSTKSSSIWFLILEKLAIGWLKINFDGYLLTKNHLYIK